jgi:hypothetical protein
MSGVSDGADDTCYLTYAESTAVADKTNVTMEYIMYSGTTDQIDGTCMGVLDKLVEANYGKLECRSKEVVVAKRVN